MIFNWLTVFEVFVGALLGFIFGLLSDFLLRKNNIKKLKRRIKDELWDIYKELNRKLENKNEILEFYNPIWESLISSAFLIYLDVNTYSKYTIIYANIKSLAEIEKTEALNSSDEKTKELAFKVLLDKRKNVIDVINNTKLLQGR